jgi:Polysaccharide biosynthesis enzyme WcbI
MRISVFGNCQADPLRSLFSRYVDAEVPFVPLNYEVTQADQGVVLADFARSDFIFVQRVSADFRVKWARPESLREMFGNRVVVWPNVYFDGYYPDVRYLYSDAYGKVVGPLSDYHFDTVLQDFQQRKTAAEAAARFKSGHILSSFPDPFGRSLQQLRRRETDCDIAISDFIEANNFRSVIQFTPNHPRSTTLIELTRRLCAHVGLQHRLDDDVRLGELDNIYLIPYPAIAERYSLPSEFGAFRGVEVSVDGDKVVLGATRNYEIEDAIAEYFKVYASVLP